MLPPLWSALEWVLQLGGLILVFCCCAGRMAPLPQLFTLGALATLCGTCYAAGNTGSVRMGWVPTGFRSSTDRVASRSVFEWHITCCETNGKS